MSSDAPSATLTYRRHMQGSRRGSQSTTAAGRFSQVRPASIMTFPFV